MKIELVSVVVQGLFFNEVVGIRKAIKILLTELVSQCRNILPLAFSALTSLRSVKYGKGCGQYIPALTSHSVNKSILLMATDTDRLSCHLIGQ